MQYLRIFRISAAWIAWSDGEIEEGLNLRPINCYNLLKFLNYLKAAREIFEEKELIDIYLLNSEEISVFFQPES